MQEQRWAEISEEEGHIDLAAQGYMGVFFPSLLPKCLQKSAPVQLPQQSSTMRL